MVDTGETCDGTAGTCTGEGECNDACTCAVASSACPGSGELTILAADGIRFNALAPGPVDTDMVRNTGAESMGRMANAVMQKRNVILEWCMSKVLQGSRKILNELQNGTQKR